MQSVPDDNDVRKKNFFKSHNSRTACSTIV